MLAAWLHDEPPEARGLFQKICAASLTTNHPRLVWQDRTPNRSSYFAPGRVVVDGEDLVEVADESGGPHTLGAVHEWALGHEVGHARQWERREPMDEPGADRWAERLRVGLGWDAAEHRRVLGTVEKRRDERRRAAGALGAHVCGLSSGFEWLGQGEEEALTHASARAGVVAGFRQVFGKEPTLREAQFAQGIALCESGYGNWQHACTKYGPDLCCGGVGSFNFGSMQSGRPPCGPGSFECIDHHADGTPYNACFMKFTNAADGFAAFIRVLYVDHHRASVLATANTGSAYDFARAMRASGYFELGLDAYAKNLEACLRTITKALGEQMPSSLATSGQKSGIIWLVGGAALAAATFPAWSKWLR